MGNEGMFAFWTGLVFGGITIGLIMGLGMSSGYKEKAIEHGCAEYSNQTGDFEWITKEIK